MSSASALGMGPASRERVRRAFGWQCPFMSTVRWVTIRPGSPRAYYMPRVLVPARSTDSRHLARTLLDKPRRRIAALLLADLHRRVMSRPAHQAATAAAFLRGGAGAGAHHQ